MTTDPTLDEVLNRLPKELTQADLEVMVDRSRQERALWETKEAKAKARKAEKKAVEGG